MSEHTVQRGQLYESCQPTSVVEGVPVRTYIRVLNGPLARDGRGKALVVTVLNGGRTVRPREIEVSQLHASSFTASGASRRTGYSLLASPEAAAPTSEEGST